MTRDEVLALAHETTCSLEQAGAALGFGRTKAREAARAGEFPVPVLRLGVKYRVPTQPLLALLGLSPPNANGAPATSAPPDQADIQPPRPESS